MPDRALHEVSGRARNEVLDFAQSEGLGPGALFKASDQAEPQIGRPDRVLGRAFSTMHAVGLAYLLLSRQLKEVRQSTCLACATRARPCCSGLHCQFLRSPSISCVLVPAAFGNGAPLLRAQQALARRVLDSAVGAREQTDMIHLQRACRRALAVKIHQQPRARVGAFIFELYLSSECNARTGEPSRSASLPASTALRSRISSLCAHFTARSSLPVEGSAASQARVH